MYNPALVQGGQRRVYEGTSRVALKLFQSTTTGSIIQVERPLGLVQRAYTDVRMRLRAIRDEENITLFPQ